MKSSEDKHKEDKGWHDNLGPWMIWPPIILVICVVAIWIVNKVLRPLPAPLSDDTITIALAFIGIIATFIVVGNFSQVSAIREEMKSHIDDHKQTIFDFQTKIKENLEDYKKERSREWEDDKKNITEAYVGAINDAKNECYETYVVPLEKELSSHKEQNKKTEEGFLNSLDDLKGGLFKIIISLIENNICQNRQDLWELLISMLNTDHAIEISYESMENIISARWSLGLEEGKKIVFNEIKGSVPKLLEKNKIKAINGTSVSIEDIDLLENSISLIQQVQKELSGSLAMDEMILPIGGDPSATEF